LVKSDHAKTQQPHQNKNTTYTEKGGKKMLIKLEKKVDLL
jgi:hypothetical protein